MDCKTARLLLTFARPHAADLEASDAAALQGHLAACPDCTALAQQERRLDEHLGRAMRDVPVPDKLRERLLKRLDDRRQEKYRRWVLTAVAATILVGAVGIYFSLTGSPTEVKLAELHEQESKKLGAVADRVEEWFHDKGFKYMTVPPRFNCDRLTDYLVVDFKGKRVPYLLFVADDVSGRAQSARVYVLSERQFNLDKLESDQDHRDDSGARLRTSVLRSAGGDVAFLILFTGHDLESVFYQPKRPPAT
jgi:hypothetical protein